MNEYEKEIKDLAKRYERFGMNENIIRSLIESESYSDIDEKSRFIGVRMILGIEFGVPEYFTVEDVMHVTGESKERVMEMMKENNISPISIDFAPWAKERFNKSE